MYEKLYYLYKDDGSEFIIQAFTRQEALEIAIHKLECELTHIQRKRR